MNRWAWIGCILLLAACESGTETDGGGGLPPPPDRIRGFFLDDAVVGLEVDQPGRGLTVTDEYGSFAFLPDEEITFLVDAVSLGTLSEGRTRITPADFGSAGANVARFLQSLDTTPATPDIDLTGIDLADTPINFLQSSSAFAADPAVQAAVVAAASAGGTGILVSKSEALVRLAAGTNGLFVADDLANAMFYAVTPGPTSEPCVALMAADGTGTDVCQDDIDADPDYAGSTFTWSIEDSRAVLLYGSDERVSVQRLGDTGNRISVDVLTECLPCNPDVEPAIETGVQTLVRPLPLTAADLEDRTFDVGSGGSLTEVMFRAEGTGTLTSNVGSQSIVWKIDPVFVDVLQVQETGQPGSTLLFLRAMLLSGRPEDGEFALLWGEGVDLDNDGKVDENELASDGRFTAIEAVSMTARPQLPACVDASCEAKAVPFSGGADAPMITSVRLECQSHAVVALATATDPQGSDNLIGIQQTFGVFPGPECLGTPITVQDDLAGSGLEESFGDVVTAGLELYDAICSCRTWPVELDFQDADGNTTTARFAADVVQ